MRRITAFAICLFLILSIVVTAAPADTSADTIYIRADGTVAKTVTYHGEEKKPAFVTGRNNGEAVVLSGTDYLTADIAELQAPFTLSAWVNWQDKAADQRIFSLVKDNSENYLALSPFTDTAVVGKPAANGVTILTSCFKEQFIRENYYHPTIAGVTDALTADTWHYVAFTVTENAVTVYIDGAQWQTVTLPFTYTELGADTLYIGSAVNGANGFVGQLQAFTVHTEALDAAVIARTARDIPEDDPSPAITASNYADATLPDATALQQEKAVIVTEKGEATFAAVSPAFWENPQVATGQTIRGTLTVKNSSNNPISLQLTDIVLPEADTPAYRYLSEINVTIMQDTTVLFDGPYTTLNAGAVGWQWPQIPNRRQFVYTIILSRPFSSTVRTVETAVQWEWETALFPIQENPLRGIPTAGWLLIVLALSAVAVGFSAYWAIVRRPCRMFTVWDTVAQKVRYVFTKNIPEADEQTDEQDP